MDAFWQWYRSFPNVMAFVLFTGFVVLFVWGMTTPLKERRSRGPGGALLSFIVLFFVEMFGFPFTLFVLYGFWGGSPRQMNLYIRDHLPPHLRWLMLVKLIAGVGLMLLGIGMVVAGWQRVYRRYLTAGKLVTDGIYRWIRHPQYAGLLSFTLGMAIQFPYIPNVITWPMLALLYYRLARAEERDVVAKFGAEYEAYRQRVPMFLPFGAREEGRR